MADLELDSDIEHRRRDLCSDGERTVEMMEKRQRQFVEFYRTHDPSRANLDTVAALLKKYPFQHIVGSLKRSFGTVPEGWDERRCSCVCTAMQMGQDSFLGRCCEPEQRCAVRTAHRLTLGGLMAIAEAQKHGSLETRTRPSETELRVANPEDASLISRHLAPALAIGWDQEDAVYVCSAHLRLLKEAPLSVMSYEVPVHSIPKLQDALLEPATVTAAGLLDQMEQNRQALRRFPSRRAWHRR